MLLTHLCFLLNFINWIMCCINKVSFSVLINGFASHYFHSERGLTQGCPISPLLFLLIMEDLSRLILEEHRLGLLQVIKITNNCILTHLLFVYDVLLFLDEGIVDLTGLHSVLTIFNIATSMEINSNKSTISSSSCSPHEIQYALHRFPFTLHTLDHKLKYLGYRLKPQHYRINDWIWLVAKIERRLCIWHHKYISRVGRLVLIKSVWRPHMSTGCP